MNKLFTKIAGLSLGLAMAIGVGVAIGTGRKDASPAQATAASYTITFNGTKSESTTISTSTTAASITGSSSYVTGNVATATKAYGATSDGVKLGTSSVAGTLKINLSASGQVTPTSIVVNAKLYNSGKSASLGVNGSTKQSVSSSFGDITFDYTTAITYIQIDVTKYVWVKSVKVNYNTSTPATSVTITGNDGSSLAPGATRQLGTTVLPAGHTDTITWSSSATSVATVSSTGLVTAVAAGSATITARANASVAGTTTITVEAPSTPAISVSPTSISSYTGASFSITATYANLTTAFAWGTPTSNDGGSIDAEVTATTGTALDGTSTYSGTLDSAGHVTLSTSGGSVASAPSVSFTITQTTVDITKSSTSIQQGGNETLAVSHNASSVGGVTWGSSDLSGKISVDSNGKVTVANDATVGATATITATSQVDSSVSDTCIVTVAQNPFAALTKVSSADDVTTDGVYALSPDGVRFVGTSISNSGLTYPITDYANVGFFKLNASGNLQLVTESNGSWSGGNNDFINNASSTNLAKGAASSVWEAVDDEVDSVVQGVMFENTSNSNRFLGLGTSDVTTATIVKAYALSNLHAGNDNLPVYLYEVSQDTLESLTISGAVPTYTAGSTFSFGRTATAYYSISGDVAVSTGLTFTLGGTAISAGDTIPVNKVGTQAVVVTYTDSNSNSVSATAYNVTVNYKGATDIELNISEASLSIGGTVSLTATVSDEYADPNAVSWASGNTSFATVSAASGTKTITVTGVAAGNTTIIATANGHSATCAISVSADPILNLLDDEENVINNQTLNHYTGDAAVYIQAHSENVVSPSYSWNNEDDSVVTIDASDYLCEVTIVGAGNSEVSVTVGSLTRTVTFSVSQSGVTAISLTSTVVSGEIWDGSYQNTLTLTPSVTKTGNATNVINWSSSDDRIATVSSASTSGTAITVTGVSAGTATITARSAYTPATYAEYEVTVKGDGVETLSWTKRPKFNSGASGFKTIWAGETTLGDLMSQNGSDGIGVFAPSWKSEKSDTPSMGTGAHNVHIVLSSISGPTSEAGLTPLTSSYVFQAADNGKYVVAFYEGKASIQNTQLSVTKWRSVTEASTATATYDFSGSTASTTAISSSTFDGYWVNTSTLEKGDSSLSYVYPEAGSIRPTSGSYIGSISIEFGESVEISSVTVRLKNYGSDATKVTVMGNDITDLPTDSFSDYTFTVEDGDFETTNVFSLTTDAKKHRCYIEKIIIVAGGEQEIGKSADCLGLEEYIDTYLHMDDYTTSQGWCKDDKHNYYGKNTETGAKYYFNQLNLHQRTLLSSNSAYAAEWARLSAWAAANGDSLNGSTQLGAPRVNPLQASAKSTGTVIAIAIISTLSLAAVGGYFLFRKKKEN